MRNSLVFLAAVLGGGFLGLNSADAQTIAIDNANNGAAGEYGFTYDWITDTYTPQAGLGTFTTGTTDASASTWATGSGTNPKFQSNYLFNQSSHLTNLTATFTPEAAAGPAGWYRVEAHANDPNGDRSTNVPYTITHMGGQTVLTESQVGWNGWRNLGGYQLDPGTTGNLMVSSEGTSTYVIADGARFTQLATGDGTLGQESTSVVADAYIRGTSGYQSTNYGSSPEVRLKAVDDHNKRKGYIQFDVSGISNAIDATLKLDFVDTSAGTDGSGDWGFNVYGVHDSVDSWDEGTITWANAPANTGGGNEFDAATSELLGGFTLNGRTGEINFASPELLDFLLADPDGLVTLAIARDITQVGNGSYVHGFASKEAGGTGATLDFITLAPAPTVPEPTTGLLALAGLFGVAITWRRRR